MKYTKPCFYDKFKCLGDSCFDTCCAGWEIDIDEDTLKMYKGLNDEIGKLLLDNINETEEGAYFKLDDSERCPFLTDEGLCRLILLGGEDMLCNICHEHPRFYEWFGNYTEVGLGLCCEEVCRLLFEYKKPITFITVDDGINNKVEDEEELINKLLSARLKAFKIVTNRRLTFGNRICNLLENADDFQSEIFGKKKVDDDVNLLSYKIISELLDIMKKTEPFDDKWVPKIDILTSNLKLIFENSESFQSFIKERKYEYEHLMMYLLYRYFMKSFWDGELSARVRFCIINVIYIYIADVYRWVSTGNYSSFDRIELVKEWSKQIEYSEDNLNMLLNECKNNPIFSVSALKGLFTGINIL